MQYVLAKLFVLNLKDVAIELQNIQYEKRITLGHQSIVKQACA